VKAGAKCQTDTKCKKRGAPKERQLGKVPGPRGHNGARDLYTLTSMVDKKYESTANTTIIPHGKKKDKHHGPNLSEGTEVGAGYLALHE